MRRRLLTLVHDSSRVAVAVTAVLVASLVPACKAKEGEACKVEAKLTCDGAKAALACHGGKWEREACKGPKGCAAKGNDAECDHATAESGDVCTVSDDHSCATDKASMVRCTSYKYATVATCRGPGGCVRTDKEATCDNSVATAGDPCTQEGDLACALDGKSTLACKDGKMTVGLACRGPKGCAVSGAAVRCDDTVSELGDACVATPGKDHYACAGDQKSLLRCDGSRYVQSDKCAGQKTCKLLGDVFGCSL